MPKPSKKLLKLLDQLLAERREPVGMGWPEVTEQDWERLHEVIDKIIEEKFARDCDGDRVISYTLVNRARCETLHYFPIPHDHKAQTEAEREDILRLIITNAHMATERLHTALDIRRFDRQRKKPTPA